MEDRYEIKGKIGQGGLGAIYRGFDVRMSREVAIKRIAGNPQDSSLSEEATRQLVQEAGSLASLQHPNIVTIYDVGTDEDGPFVVMELLTGETLEEIVGRGSFTWQDFRQFALQTLEGLIAAQELHIVHRDLKPGNIMLTWLPSGKFQVKIVDFGLAKLSSTPSLQTIDQSDGVFGSIYFMAPEQFERVPLDHRVDLYAIGCVFYYALTGTYPYDGDTVAEVMASHLQHHVTPLHEVREGIPLWVCDWIMWHINRLPSDRPESAREALKYFVENDSHLSPTLSTGVPVAAPDEPKRPRLLMPGSAPVPEVIKDPTPTLTLKTATTPRPIKPPEGHKPSVHTTSQVFQTAPGQVSHEGHTPNNPVHTSSVPVLARKTAAVAPALARSTQSVTGAMNPTLGATAPAATKTVVTPVTTPKNGLPVGLKIAIATVVGLLTIFGGVLLMQNSSDDRDAQTSDRVSGDDGLDIADKNLESPPSATKPTNASNASNASNAPDAPDAPSATNTPNADKVATNAPNADEVAAIIALGTGADDADFKTLIDYLASGPEPQLRAPAFDSALNFATNTTRSLKDTWTLLAAQSKTGDEQLKLIGGLANLKRKPWIYGLLNDIVDNSEDDPAVDLAKRTLLRLRDNQKTGSSSSSETSAEETPVGDE